MLEAIKNPKTYFLSKIFHKRDLKTTYLMRFVKNIQCGLTHLI